MTSNTKHIALFFVLLVFLIGIALWIPSDAGRPEEEDHDSTAQKPNAGKVSVKHVASAAEDTSSHTFSFPRGFTWGVATSAFQTEGGNGLTDWDAWEKYNTAKAYHPGFTEKDIALAAQLGIQELRFSIEWARIEPAEGVWDRKELARVARLVQIMQRHSIRPFPNLHHFTLPRWVAEKGGLENDSFPYWYARYAGKVAKRLKPFGIVRWMTFKEPIVPIETGYLNGAWPPQKSRDIGGAAKATWHFVAAHKRAYIVLHRTLDTTGHRIQVGMAYLDHLFLPENPKSDEDNRIVHLMNFGNEMMIRATEDYMDYVGLNYYTRSVVSFSTSTVMFGRLPVAVGYANNKDADGSMEIYPEGIRMLVARYYSFKKPILITENGVNDRKDLKRAQFISDHLRELHRALPEAKAAGAPIIGYFYWTLTDNFEWDERKLSHFGLIGVDPKTGAREVRSSALFFRDAIRARGVSEKMRSDYHLQ